MYSLAGERRHGSANEEFFANARCNCTLRFKKPTRVQRKQNQRLRIRVQNLSQKQRARRQKLALHARRRLVPTDPSRRRLLARTKAMLQVIGNNPARRQKVSHREEKNASRVKLKLLNQVEEIPNLKIAVRVEVLPNEKLKKIPRLGINGPRQVQIRRHPMILKTTKTTSLRPTGRMLLVMQCLQ